MAYLEVIDLEVPSMMLWMRLKRTPDNFRTTLGRVYRWRSLVASIGATIGSVRNMQSLGLREIRKKGLPLLPEEDITSVSAGP